MRGFFGSSRRSWAEDDPRMDMDEGDYYNYQRARYSTEERFRQEMECDPEDEASVYLPYDLLQGSFYQPKDNLVAHTEETTDFPWQEGAHSLPSSPVVSQPEGLKKYLASLKMGTIYHGKDVARKKDLSVDIFGEKRDGMTFVRAVVEFDRVAFSRQESVLYPLLPLVTRSCVDETGIGYQFAERGGEKFGAHKVEGISFSPGTKAMLAGPVRTGFEDRIFRIPEDDLFVDDLRMIRKETVGDNVRYVASDDEEGDSHADRFWALALMYHAGSTGRHIMMPKRGRKTRHGSARKRRRERGCQ